MNSEGGFKKYLERIEDDLLELVAADFAGLEALFQSEQPGRAFVARREACRAECLRRHRPELFRRAEHILDPEVHPAA